MTFRLFTISMLMVAGALMPSLISAQDAYDRTRAFAIEDCAQIAQQLGSDRGPDPSGGSSGLENEWMLSCSFPNNEYPLRSLTAYAPPVIIDDIKMTIDVVNFTRFNTSEYARKWETTVSEEPVQSQDENVTGFISAIRKIPDGHIFTIKSVHFLDNDFQMTRSAQVSLLRGSCILTVGVDVSQTDLGNKYHFYDTKKGKLVDAHPGFNHDREVEAIEMAKQNAEKLIGALDCGDAPMVTLPSTPPTESIPRKVTKDLVIASFTPDSIMAGEGMLNPLSGFVHYETLAKPFLIEGKNLQGLTMSADNVGLDGELGITFSDIQVSGDGTVATGYIKSRGVAMDGQTTVTIRNGAGRSVTREIKVDITGTQYLKRTFGETVLFLGDWTDVVPNAHITNLEKGIKNGLKYTWAIGYLKLRILPTIYEEGVWHLAPCSPDTQITTISGCASPENKTIHLRDEPEEITPTIFHEAVHKLDYWHRGQYRGTPSAPISPDGFFGSWVAAAARPEGYPPCQFLPLQNSVTWKDGTDEVPHCGFIVAYGASDRGGGEDVMAVGARENPANLIGFYEDVATMAESHIFNPELFNLPEVSADPRYNKKVNLLRQYVFFP